MSAPELLREISMAGLERDVASGAAPIVFVAAPNFEDRSVRSAGWMLEALDGRNNDIAAQVVWLQTPGVDDIFDRIKADNRDRVVSQFRYLGSRLAETRIDLPATDVNVVMNRNRDFVNKVGRGAVLIIDISSLPRTIVRHLLDGIVRDQLSDPGTPRYSRIVCLYTAAGAYPVGADSDMIGGVLGYFTKRSIHDLISTAGILDAVVSLAGTSHDSAQTLDAMWEHGLSARTTLSSVALLNRENFVYSYQRLAHAAWVLNRARDTSTDLVYAFELADVIQHIFARTETAIQSHVEYRRAGGEGLPTYLIGGYGPKPIGLAALLASMRYRRAMESRDLMAVSDVLQVRGWQYTTRYSHGVGALRAFEIDVAALHQPPEIAG